MFERPAMGARLSLYCGGNSMISSSSGGGCTSSRSVCRINRGGGLYVATPAIAALRAPEEVILGLCHVFVPSPDDPAVIDSIPLSVPVNLRD